MYRGTCSVEVLVLVHRQGFFVFFDLLVGVGRGVGAVRVVSSAVARAGGAMSEPVVLPSVPVVRPSAESSDSTTVAWLTRADDQYSGIAVLGHRQPVLKCAAPPIPSRPSVRPAHFFSARTCTVLYYSCSCTI